MLIRVAHSIPQTRAVLDAMVSRLRRRQRSVESPGFFARAHDVPLARCLTAADGGHSPASH
jgi:hypothetical protein